jgi:protein gp37
MNKTKIEWVKNDDGTQGYTWNPVTGCLHGCEYCYARGIARRFGCDNYNGKLHEISQPIYRYKGDKPSRYLPFPYGFDPTFHRYRLDEPQKVKKPSTVFVGSMTDLFGEWVPDEWIRAVFEACAKAPQHRYIFLTKNPKRYERYEEYMPDNMWFGWSQTKPCGIGFKTHHSWNTFASLEPMHEEFKEFTPSCGWIIVGAESGNRKNKVVPKKEWIENIANECAKAKKPLFMKDSLKDIWGEPLIQQLPWGVYAL